MPTKIQTFRQFLLKEASYDEKAFKEYMKTVDRILENKFGFGHEQLEDYMWMDMFMDEYQPEDAVMSFIEDTYGSDYDMF